MKKTLGLSALLVSLSIIVFSSVFMTQYFDWNFGVTVFSFSALAWVLVGVLLVDEMIKAGD